ncbi:MAG: alpha amylase C-terminal domain-containing protein [Quinella sp. 1Q7]|nr:alpha amylase C-terminal domain-containing protein [Quinella sp. 1Q7]
MANEHIGLVAGDSWLEPYEEAIRGRHEHALWKIGELTQHGKRTLSDFADGHLYFGLHRTADGWIFREWAPHAVAIYLVGEFNDWQETEAYRCKQLDGGNWELKLPADALKHGQLYKMHVRWDNGSGERIPAWCQRVVQDDKTKIFSAQVWDSNYTWHDDGFKIQKHPLFIYECHVGMSQDAEKVGTYTEFKDNVLPRVKKAGYTAIQVMAIQEHPYYGSFGYHVSSFFAPSSRCGTPDELKAMIDAAHQMGIAVIMDIVHSHAVKNEVEGLGNLAGDPNQFFYEGDRHEHPAWDSLCFDYGKDDVLHFLLSNCKYWLQEYHFDGFRFDGVTSMLYYSHGLGEAFTSYGDYFNGHQDDNAICYLMLANKLIHEVKPDAITIAEDVSGMPGLAAKFEDGGFGFDYRLAMNVPDYWIKTIKELKDEDWKPSSIFWELTNRRAGEKTVSYAESHDQALVGDKTIIFRLIDADMYWHFRKGDENAVATRGIALHKLIRLVTASTINGGYLNFMGNEFGHPEWIDFPREGNGWSYKYAQRQWHLLDDKTLCYHWLGDFDRAMLETIKSEPNFEQLPVVEIWHDDGDQVLAYMRGKLVFVFNFSPTTSYTGYGFLVPKGKYKVVLNSDNPDFGGFGLTDDSITHITNYDPLYDEDRKGWLKLYIPARSGVVLRKQ